MFIRDWNKQRYSIICIQDTHFTKHIEKIYYDRYNHAKELGHNVTFKFKPKMKGWYCSNDNKCTEISFYTP